MLTKIVNTTKCGKQHGGFGIQILYPGLISPELNDSGFYMIGKIDPATITPGTPIPMHPHKDDEILTYLRSGMAKYLDSEGLQIFIRPDTAGFFPMAQFSELPNAYSANR